MSQTYRLGVLDGDGIGPEIVPVAVRVATGALERAGAGVEWLPLPVGLAAIESHGAALPASTLRALETLDGWVLGPHDNMSYPPEHRTVLNPSGFLRKHFDLYANIRPARAFPGTRATAPGIDLVVVRENTEGFYADRNMHAGTGEFMPSPDVAMSVSVFTRPAIERIARTAFELAMTRRRHVTIVHKANVLTLTTGLFRDVCREAAAAYPAVLVDDFHIDALAAHLVRRPGDFDVLVAENMFGDILSDLAGELAGSLGLAPSINASDAVAMAQAVHGAAPDIAGKGVANPTAMVLSTAMLLDWLGRKHADESLVIAAKTMERAVEGVLALGIGTADLGGTLGTAAFGEALVGWMRDER
ncbi:MAG: isocitrate/isopropylmalate dehydrogenase family protein [Dehalococcoidia bacterium]